MHMATPSTSPARTRNDVELGPLQPYFRDLSLHDVMTAEEEVATARTIAAQRRAAWLAILDYPPCTVAVTDLLARRAELDPAVDPDIVALRAASRALRDRDTRAHADEFAARCAALVERMSKLDVDTAIADEVVAELDAIAAGAEGERTLILASAPRQGSRPFAAYRASIRGPMTALRAARARFVAANLRLVVLIARRYHRGTLGLADRIQEGSLGLIKAVMRFDPDMGCRFSTYGAWWIRHAITRALADRGRVIRLPVHLVEAGYKVARARRSLRGDDGGEPTNEAVAAATGLSLARIDRVDAAQLESTISLDGAGRSEDSGRPIDVLADDGALPGEQLDAEVLHTQLQAAFASLPAMEADILRQRFGLVDDQEKTLREIAAQYSLSRERIRQLQEQAIGKIRHAFQRHL